MKRSLGIELHTNSFTCCYLQADGSETIRTWPLQGGGLEQFLTSVHAEDDVALEATGNAAHFCKMVEPHVSRVVVIAPWQFEVIRRSVQKTDKHDARTIALFLSKDMLPEAVSRATHMCSSRRSLPRAINWSSYACPCWARYTACSSATG